MAPTDAQAPVTPRADLCVLTVPFWNPTYDEFKSWWDWALDHAPRPQMVGLANAHSLNIAHGDRRFMDVLHRSDANLNDGVGFRIAGRMRGVETKYNFAGTDLVPRLFSEAHREIGVFFYGATEESNRLTVENMIAKHPRVVCAGRLHGYADPVGEALPAIRASGADVLLCALGQPQQEFFISENLGALNVRVAVGVGGLFDFVSGSKPRAPLGMRKLGMEWAYRLAIEPRRMFRRYVIGNPVFLWRALWSAKSDVRCAAGYSEGRRSIEDRS